MSPTSHFKVLPATAWALALVALLALGCGEKSPEELLAEATEELTGATQAKDAAKASLDQLDERLAKAQSARDTAFEAFEEARIRWESAKDAVGEFATDEVLHQQINRLLLDASELGESRINARVSDHVVALTGSADGQEAIDHAIELVGSVPGVYRVASQVRIEAAQDAEGAAPEADSEASEEAAPSEPEPDSEASEAPASADSTEETDDGVATEEYDDNVVPGPGSDWHPEADPMTEDLEATRERQI